MTFLRTLIVAFIVMGVLDLITKRNQKKSTESLESFVVRAPIDMAFLGVIDMAFCIGILLYSEYDGTVIPLLVMILFIIVGVVPGVLLMLAPIQGLWDVRVERDDVTVVKGFIYRRHWKFSDISHGEITRGGIKVFVEGRERKAFFVDGMCRGTQNFIERMKRDGKEIVGLVEEEEKSEE